MASHVAASAFGHCLALVRDEEAAAELALVAIRRGGRSVAKVLGHARHEALSHIARAAPEPVELAPSAGPSDVAWALAASRPAVEVSIVDLGGRYGLGPTGLGTALGLPPAAAAARVAAAGRAWDAELDPALLAWLGPGDCDQLAAVLAGRPRHGAADLLTVAGDVAAHTAGCAPCGDRQRAAASVRLLLTGTPLPVPPPAVEAAAGRVRLQPGAPPPPLDAARRRTGARLLAGAVAVAAVAVVVGVVVVARRDGDPTPAAQALGRLPATEAALELLPSELELSAGEVSLLNTSAAAVTWEAHADAAWLAVDPARGRLLPGREQVLRLSGSPPEGDVRTAVRVAGDDGSAAAAVLTGTVEHPPDLSAAAEGCRVTAVVEDETEVALMLHARGPDGVETRTAMTAGDTGATGDLPDRQALTWWVSAVDGRGNQARTADGLLPDGC